MTDLKPDMLVEYTSDNRNWRLARLMQHKPYHHRGGYVTDGWYVSNLNPDGTPARTDPVTGITPSMGGWVMSHCMREVSK